MVNLIPLDQNTIVNRFDTIHHAKRNPTYDALTALRPRIIARYHEYLTKFNNNTLEQFIVDVYNDDEKECLQHCYGNMTNALDRLIVDIKENQPDATRTVCQFCGIGTDSTIDHYIPKGDFPEFSVNHLNLFPCCADCNSIKREYWKDLQTGTRGIINLYLDPIPQEQFLFVDIIFFGSVPHARFELRNIHGIDADLFSIIEKHYIRLNLTDRYKDKFSTIYTHIKSRLSQSKYVNNIPLIKSFLSEEIDTEFRLYGRNHYKGIIYENLMENNDFLNQF